MKGKVYKRPVVHLIQLPALGDDTKDLYLILHICCMDVGAVVNSSRSKSPVVVNFSIHQLQRSNPQHILIDLPHATQGEKVKFQSSKAV